MRLRTLFVGLSSSSALVGCCASPVFGCKRVKAFSIASASEVHFSFLSSISKVCNRIASFILDPVLKSFAIMLPFFRRLYFFDAFINWHQVGSSHAPHATVTSPFSISVGAIMYPLVVAALVIVLTLFCDLGGSCTSCASLNGTLSGTYCIVSNGSNATFISLVAFQIFLSQSMYPFVSSRARALRTNSASMSLMWQVIVSFLPSFLTTFNSMYSVCLVSLIIPAGVGALRICFISSS